MVLLDMVGDCDLAIPREASSDEALYSLFADADPSLFDGTAPASRTTTSRSSRPGSRPST